MTLFKSKKEPERIWGLEGGRVGLVWAWDSTHIYIRISFGLLQGEHGTIDDAIICIANVTYTKTSTIAILYTQYTHRCAATHPTDNNKK